MLGRALAAFSLMTAPVPATPARAQEGTASTELPPPQDQVDLGQVVVDATRRAADSYREKPKERLCFRYVKMGLQTALGLTLVGKHAYMAADQLALAPNFQEVQKKPLDLPALPPGSVVVWGRSKRHPSGHISVADGQGFEISDRVRQQITGYGTQMRVFVLRPGR